jgi:hypothetical protein
MSLPGSPCSAAAASIAIASSVDANASTVLGVFFRRPVWGILHPPFPRATGCAIAQLLSDRKRYHTCDVGDGPDRKRIASQRKKRTRAVKPASASTNVSFRKRLFCAHPTEHPGLHRSNGAHRTHQSPSYRRKHAASTRTRKLVARAVCLTRPEPSERPEQREPSAHPEPQGRPVPPAHPERPARRELPGPEPHQPEPPAARRASRTPPARTSPCRTGTARAPCC